MRYRWIGAGLALVLAAFSVTVLSLPHALAGSDSPSAWRMVGQIGGPTQAVAVQGEYAYVGVGLRLVVLDVSNPTNPTEVGSTAPFPYFVEDIAVSGTLAYVAAGGAGLRVVNVSDPTHPLELGAWDSPGYAEGVAVAGSTVYLADGPYGLRVVDVTDPVHPRPLGSAYDMDYAFDVAVSGPLVYIAAAGAGLLVVDVADPSQPRELATLDTPGYAQGLAVDRAEVYIADEWEGIQVVDVSDPANPSLVRHWYPDGWAFGVSVIGGRVYVAAGFAGLRLYDVTPTGPVELGAHTVTGGHAGSIAVAGQLALVADSNWGLRIVSVADSMNPTQLGSYRPLSQGYRLVVQDGVGAVAAGPYGLRMIDFAEPSRPVEVGTYDIGSVASSVAVSGHFAYVSGPPGPHVGLNVIDIADPRHPVRVGLYQGFGECRDLAVSADIAYLATGDDLLLVGVSDPAHPTYLGRINMCEPDELLTGAVGLAVSGNLVYVATQMSGLRIVDVSDPKQPTLIGAARWPNGFLQDLVVAEGVAYVADSGGLTVVDVSDPHHPTRIGFCDTPGFAEGVALSGRYAYVADGGTGLAVIDVSNPRAPMLVATHNTVGYVQDVAVSGGWIYLAELEAGVSILEHGTSLSTAAAVDSSPPTDPRSSPARQGPLSVASAAVARPEVADPVSQTVTSLAIALPASPEPPLEDLPRESAGLAASCVVTSTDDHGPGTLRSCLEQAAAGDSITFSSLFFPPSHPVTIQLTSPLPWLTCGQVAVDASNAGVILDGAGTPPSTCGLVLASQLNVVQGLQLVSFPEDAIHICGAALGNRVGGSRLRGSGPVGEGNRLAGCGGNGVSIVGTGADGNIICGNLIGTDLSATGMDGNENGVVIAEGARYNQIGSLDPAECNVISGNRDNEILIYAETLGNTIQGNLIGTDSTGSFALRRAAPSVGWVAGVNLAGGQSNVVGPDNLISGVSWGINVTGEDNRDSVIVGNHIGTDITGTAVIGNFGPGIFVNGGPQGTRIGGASPIERNLISGNGGTGIAIDAESSIVIGNYIGTDASGTVALGNMGGSGVSVGGTHNVIGGLGPGETNVISGNAYYGVSFGAGATEDTVIGNYIGLDASGSQVLSNGDIGLGIEMGAYDNRVERNVIVSTGRNCIVLNDWGSSYNTVVGNLLGTDASGEHGLGGGFSSVYVGGGAAHNRLGGTTAAERNVIAGGIEFGRQGAPGNLIMGNYIGTDTTGTRAIGTTNSGVTLGNGGQRPFIGGATAAEGNIISGNPAPDGIRIYPGVHYAFISNNRIGTDASGVAPLGNRGNGVSIEGGEHSFVQGNTIAFNGATGVKVGTSCNNSIRRNSIHSNDEGGIVLADGGNDMLPAPVITSARPTQVSGTACPGCTVEVFSDDVDQGRVYEGTTVADALGRFTFSSPGGLTGPFITATATDGEGNTSDFSSPMAVGESVYLPLVLKAWKGKPE